MTERVLDVFAGPGGWDVAAARIGCDVTGIEIEGDACRTRAAAGHKTVQGDVRALDLDDWVGIDGLIASPPCPDFSIAGLKRGLDGTTGALVYEVPRLVSALKPTWFACEQVPKVLPFWEEFAAQFVALGYHTWTGVLDANEFGVPQHRKRAVLIGSLVHHVGIPWATERPTVADALGWSPETLFGFPRRDDGQDAVVLDGVAYRARDLRPASRPAYTLTEKARSWSVWDDGVHRRRLDIREAAQLQTFPPDYPFQGTRTSKFHQIGDAVPPAFARAILAEVIRIVVCEDCGEDLCLRHNDHRAECECPDADLFGEPDAG